MKDFGGAEFLSIIGKNRSLTALTSLLHVRFLISSMKYVLNIYEISHLCVSLVCFIKIKQKVKERKERDHFSIST